MPEQRIVYTYDLYHNGNKLSVSLATIPFKPVGKAMLLSVTEQGVFLDGYDDAGSRERGTREAIEKLAETL